MSREPAAEAEDRTAQRLGELLRKRAAGHADLQAETQASGQRLLHVALRRRQNRRLVLVAALVPLFCAVIGVTALWPWSNSSAGYTVVGANQHDGFVSVPRRAEPAQVEFHDGSTVRLDAGTQFRIVQFDSEAARLEISHGKARVHVVRSKRIWTVRAGPFLVTVRGTIFETNWDVTSQTFSVDLQEGKLSVVGPLLDGPIRIDAGQVLTVELETEKLSVTSAKPARTESASQDAPSEPDGANAKSANADPQRIVTSEAEGGAGEANPPSWRELVSSGKFEIVVEQAQSRGIGRSLEQATVADLAALADAARYSGRRALARQTLERLRSRFPDSVRSRTASFLLGRLAEADGDTVVALTWYERYLQEAPSGSFAQEALGRKMAALNQLERTTPAQSVASEYLRRFPSGPHSRLARSLLSAP